MIFPLPDGIQAEVERQVSITLRGADKALLGQTAAKLRALRKPDPYKGKGIKYPTNTFAEGGQEGGGQVMLTGKKVGDGRSATCASAPG